MSMLSPAGRISADGHDFSKLYLKLETRLHSENEGYDRPDCFINIFTAHCNISSTSSFNTKTMFVHISATRNQVLLAAIADD